MRTRERGGMSTFQWELRSTSLSAVREGGGCEGTATPGSLESFGEDGAREMVASGTNEVQRLKLRDKSIKTIMNVIYFRRVLFKREVEECPVLMELDLKAPELLHWKAMDSRAFLWSPSLSSEGDG